MMTTCCSVKQSILLYHHQDQRRQPPSLSHVSVPVVAKANRRRPSLHLSSGATACIGLRHSQMKKPPPRFFECAATCKDETGDNNIDWLMLNGLQVTDRHIAFFFLLSLSNFTFYIFTKRLLDLFPYPWIVSALPLAAATLMNIGCWHYGVFEYPETDLQFWKSLFPVAAAHAIGHVALTVSMSKMALPFTHIIRCGEPVFSVLLSRLLLGPQSVSPPLYLTLLPIIGGCALAAATELNISTIGLATMMISNFAFALRNIFTERAEMNGKVVNGANYYACQSILSLLILAPFTLAIEGPQMWAAGLKTAISQFGSFPLCWSAVALSFWYQMYNVRNYQRFPNTTPFSFIVSNTMLKISGIVSSIMYFHARIQPINALGAAIAILGVFLYSREVCKDSRIKSCFL